jgi:DNA-binding response OmpR family regulator
LLVEDHVPTRDVLRRALTRRGWDVSEATTIAEGLTRLDLEYAFDCIMLDLMLPDGEGEVILRKVRTEGSPTRVVVVTAICDPARLREVSYCRPDAVLYKPSDLEGLCRACEP